MIFYVILPCISLHIIQNNTISKVPKCQNKQKINIANISNTTDRLVTLSY